MTDTERDETLELRKALAAIAGRAHFPAGAKRQDLVSILVGIEEQAKSAATRQEGADDAAQAG